MKQIAIVVVTIIVFASCHTVSPTALSTSYNTPGDEPPITQSLFNDKNATISEENIQRILDGHYSLPQKMRVAIVKLETNQSTRRYYWSDEQYLKNQQAYSDQLSAKFTASQRVTKISTIPDLLIATNPSFTTIREAAVRTQADVVVIYSITSNIYSKYKFFSKADIKAFATTQLIVLDVRTGLIPFSTIVTKDQLSQKKPEELDNTEASARIQNEAVSLTLNEIGQRLGKFLEGM